MKRNKLLTTVLALVLSLTALGTSSCGEATCEYEGDSRYYVCLDDKFNDYARDGSVTLGLDYQGKDFYLDGIGQMDVLLYIDGDTTHFTPRVDSTGKGTVKARYYGIDTPESTGNIEKWGKEASIFTESCLKQAKTIVVSTARDDYGAPETDSTGSRYVSLVWISFDKEDCPYDELLLLNLMIVQYGLSWVKSVNSMPGYAQTFYDAQNQAEKYGLCLWDPITIPPNWPEDECIGVSLFEMQYEIKKDLEAKAQGLEYSSPLDNQRVFFSGTVAGFVNHTFYLVDYYDMEFLDEFYESKGEENPYEEGQWAGINVYAGMGTVRSKYQERGAYLQMYGLFQQSENYGFQVTDVAGHFPAATSYSAEDCQILLTAEENTLPGEEGGHALEIESYTFEEINAIASEQTDIDRWDLLCRRVQITDYVEVKSVTVTDSDNIYLYFNTSYGGNFCVEVTFNYKGSVASPNDIFDTEEEYLNRNFLFGGNLTFHITSSGRLQLMLLPNDANDIIWDQGVTN